MKNPTKKLRYLREAWNVPHYKPSLNSHEIVVDISTGPDGGDPKDPRSWKIQRRQRGPVVFFQLGERLG